MKKRYRVKIGKAFLGPNDGYTDWKHAAWFESISDAARKCKALFGDKWEDIATIEKIPSGECLQGVNIGTSERANQLAKESWKNGFSKKRRQQFEGMMARKHPMRFMAGEIKGEFLYVGAKSKLRAAELLHEVGLVGTYWTIYRHFKKKIKLPFAPHLKAQEGVWREVKGRWTKVL
jgi:hypothetical protein